MAWMVCRNCSARFAVGLLRCPQCRAVSELFAVPDYVADAEEENMPKITVGGGASNALGAPNESDAGPALDVAPEPEVVAESEPAMPQEKAPAEPEASAAKLEEEPSGAPEDELAEGARSKDAAAPAPKKRASRKPASDAGSTDGA